MALGSITTIIGIASTALQAVGAFQAASARKRQAEYQAQVARNNAEIAEQNKRDAEIRGRGEEYEHRRKVARALSAQRAATASSGLMLDEEGTTQEALELGMIEAGEMDVMTIRDNVRRQQRKSEIQSMNFQAQAGQFELQAASEKPFLAALTAGLGGISQNADVLFPNAGVN
jgi:hypothetical protein